MAGHKRGRGSIERRKPGTYRLTVAVNGKRHSRTVHVATKREAEEHLAVFVAELEAVDDPDDLGMTLRALCERYIARSRDRLSINTVKSYSKVLAYLDDIGTTPVEDLSAPALEDFYGRLTAKGYSARTVRQVHALIRVSLKLAVKYRLVAYNVAADATPPPIHRAELHIPDPGVVADIIDHASDRYRLAFQILTATSMRAGEVCALRWGDLDLDAGTLVIDESIATDERHRPFAKTTKTHGVRTIRLDPKTVALLREHRQWTREEAMRAGGVRIPDTGFVLWDSPDGRHPWDPQRLTTAWIKARKESGHQGVRLHDIRHLGATRLLEAGVDAASVAQRLGHSSANTTLGLYAHGTQEADDRAAEIMGDLFHS